MLIFLFSYQFGYQTADKAHAKTELCSLGPWLIEKLFGGALMVLPRIQTDKESKLKIQRKHKKSGKFSREKGM